MDHYYRWQLLRELSFVLLDKVSEVLDKVFRVRKVFLHRSFSHRMCDIDRVENPFSRIGYFSALVSLNVRLKWVFKTRLKLYGALSVFQRKISSLRKEENLCLFKLSAEAVPGDRPADLLNNSDPVLVWRLLEGFVGLGFCTTLPSIISHFIGTCNKLQNVTFIVLIKVSIIYKLF